LLHPSIHIVDEKIDSLESTNAFLLVQSGEGFLGFAAFQPAQKKVYGWVVYKLEHQHSTFLTEEKLKEIIAAHPWVGRHYEKVILVQLTSKNILVPAILNKEDNKENLFELVYGKRRDDIYVKDFVLQQNLVNHYAVEGTLGVVLNQKFPKGQWWHAQSLLLTRQAAGEIRITATIWFNELQLTAEKNGRWLLLQAYSYHTPEDVLYYILNAMQQLALSQEETTVYLQGMINQQSALYDVLYHYILNLQLKNELQFQFPETTEDQPIHLSASLDQLLSCVS
jgi:hypothetical protein